MKPCPYCRKRPVKTTGHSKKTCGHLKCQYLRHLEVMSRYAKARRDRKKKAQERALMV